ASFSSPRIARSGNRSSASSDGCIRVEALHQGTVTRHADGVEGLSMTPRMKREAMLRKLRLNWRALWGPVQTKLKTSRLLGRLGPGSGRAARIRPSTRRGLVTAVGSAAVLVTIVAVTRPYLDDYLTLRQQRESLAAMAPRLAEQQALIDLYQTRMREL